MNISIWTIDFLNIIMITKLLDGKSVYIRRKIYIYIYPLSLFTNDNVNRL